MISKGYCTPDQLRKSSKKSCGLDYTESLEMAYENIQNDARMAVKNVKAIVDARWNKLLYDKLMTVK